MPANVKVKSTKEKVPPGEYRSFIKGIELEDIFFNKTSFGLLAFKKEFWKEKININIKEKTKLLKQNQKRFIIGHNYDLVISNATRKEEKFLKISANLVVEYSSEQKITKEIFELFQEINLPVNTWPYFREYVHSCMGRLNLPPLVLPALKRP